MGFWKLRRHRLLDRGLHIRWLLENLFVQKTKLVDLLIDEYLQLDEGTVADLVMSCDFAQVKHKPVHVCKHLMGGRILKILQWFLKTNQLLEKILELRVATCQRSLLKGH